MRRGERPGDRRNRDGNRIPAADRRAPDGAARDVASSAIEDRSPMPENLMQTKDEMRDLLAF